MVITSPPQDTTVFEGGNATFQCMGENNGSPVTVGWRFTPRGSSSEVSLATGTTLTGIEMVTVSGGLRTALTFHAVRREADGGTVVCVAVGSSSSVTSDPATLTVQCESARHEDTHMTTFYYTVSCLMTGDRSYPTLLIPCNVSITYRRN